MSTLCWPEILYKLDFERYETPTSDTYPGVLTTVEQDQEDFSTFKNRVERLARDYLNGGQLLIKSATLRGPFTRDWKNPWAERNGPKVSQKSSLKRKRVPVPAKRIKQNTRENRAQDSSKLGAYEEEHNPTRERSPATNSTECKPGTTIPVLLKSDILVMPAIPSERKSRSEHSDARVAPRCDVEKRNFGGALTSAGELPNVSHELLAPGYDIESLTAAGPTTPISLSTSPLSVADVGKQFRTTPVRLEPIRRIGKPIKLKRCAECDTTTTGTWRRGPDGPSTLCNACGLRWRYTQKKLSGPGAGITSAANDTMRPGTATCTNTDIFKVTAGTAMAGLTIAEDTAALREISPNVAKGERHPIPKPICLQSLSQPEISEYRPAQVSDSLRGTSSSCPHSMDGRKNPNQKGDVWRKMFPNGVLCGVEDMHGQLLDLLQNDGISHLEHRLGPSPAPAKPKVDGSHPRRRKRVMTFETPVSKHHRPHDAKAQGLPAKTFLLAPQGAAGDSPHISTQTAILHAHQAFQEALISPAKEDFDRDPPQEDSQEHGKCIITPFVQIGTNKLPNGPNKSKTPAAPVNTQALFDAFPSFTPSSSERSTTSKRASFAPAEMGPSSQTGLSTGSKSRRFSSSNMALMKSALKNASARRASAAETPTSSKGGNKVSAMQTTLTAGEGVAVDDDSQLDSFLDEADSFLSNWKRV